MTFKDISKQFDEFCIRISEYPLPDELVVESTKTFLHSTLDEYVRELVPMENKRKPTHGTCCTCQECGYGYDDCVCQKNTWSRELLKQHEENLK